MTRTERNQSVHALLKDRHSRSGINKNEFERKQGAGAHNWGSFKQEGEYESQAGADAMIESAEDRLDREGEGENDEMFKMEEEEGDLIAKKANGRNHENLQDGTGGENARDLASDELVNKDLARDAISTSPTDSMSSLGSDNGGNQGNMNNNMKGRRMSNVSEEERARAKVYREGVMANGGPVNLTNIARTSFGVASPPRGNAFGTSPTKQRTNA